MATHFTQETLERMLSLWEANAPRTLRVALRTAPLYRREVLPPIDPWEPVDPDAHWDCSYQASRPRTSAPRPYPWL